MHERRRSILRSSALPTMRVNLTPMIDVVFLLLIYFVLIADFVEPEQTTPYTSAAQGSALPDPFALPVVPDVLRVTTTDASPTGFSVEEPTGIFNTTIDQSFNDIASRAQEQLGPDRPIIVAPALDATWEHVVMVYSSLRDAGFEAVALQTDNESDAP